VSEFVFTTYLTHLNLRSLITITMPCDVCTAWSS